MTGLASLPTSLAETGTVSTGETVLFWVLAPLMVLAALGLLFARRAVYAALCVIAVMISLAILYIAQEATFLGVAQVVVYTGAIMMLFLFVLMLVGVDASDSLHETVKGQRWVAALAGLGLALVLGAVVLTATVPDPAGLVAANIDTNPVGVARLLFSDHVFAMELTGALFITAAVGAVTLTHRQRLSAKVSQRDVADAKMAAYAAGRGRVTQLPAPGVYARSNAADLPALAATGEPIEESVPRVLRIRGQQRTIGDVSPETVEAIARARSGEPGAGLHGPEASRGVGQAGLPAMRGEAPPVPQLPGSPEPPTLTETSDQPHQEDER
ncbi:NADH-quinone oxidoreductase subunit J [Georgenia subflava]|uniref:NADH-quinone oxidoreductase subunit J n=1 Tax=Georgenia subflava TaxID=1622177 RepID=A0A6N7EI11_9MICO|nr:NADH-quinone oxidoreductase subunit J [Georgenia subflava]MPV37769.1 NADH-quinone oxidoreductase subunit J [Georgenia subflava]